MDYLEILDFCAFDISEAAKIVRDIIRKGIKNGMEAMESQSDRSSGRGLRCPGDSTSV